MAAPASKTLKDLNGKWVMNKTLSDSTDPALSLQGIGFLTRKAVGIATVTLHVKQHQAAPSPPSTSTEPVTHIDIEQTATGGIKGTTEKRCFDSTYRDHADWMFGKVKGQSNFLARAELVPKLTALINDAAAAEFLAEGWLDEGEEHALSHVESLDNGWTATQIWGFQDIGGERRYARNIVIKKGDQKVEFRLVYDYIGAE